MPQSRRLRILTWHVHGNYLHYLSHAPHDFVVATRPGDPPGHAGLGGHLPWRSNLSAVPEHELADQRFDAVLHQSDAHWQARHRVLTPAQLRLPQIRLEHDPPPADPTDSVHPAADAATVIVHVTHFNALAWDNGAAPVRVIEHGVALPEGVRWSGEYPRGIVVVNHLRRRGRRLGADIYLNLRRRIPLDHVGMAATEMPGGLGEIPNPELPAFIARYRFFLNPIRWTSLGLAVVEAMTLGMPIVGLATTELASVIDRDVQGWIDSDETRLAAAGRALIDDPALAARWGAAARELALERFGIGRFAADWDELLREVCE
ncbi:glycosyltransferase [Derxia gummosa]|uniref:Glycosyltransferase n=1 Tax=Derxia gummosa DSM 723 TaxID=1121388 RepID=A0A8B6X1Q2_9BURK|nr:glycosyltransferase [Derxia gummosa]